MTTDQITGLLRAILAAIGGFILAKGWVNAENWAWITGGILSVGPVIWSWIANRPASIAASAQALPGVNVTTTAAAGPAVEAAVAAAK